MSEGGSSGAAPDAPRLRMAIGWGIVALLVVSSLAVGTVHDWTRAVVFIGSAALLAATIIERRRSAKRFPITVPQVALAAATLMTIAQLIPLPAAVLAVISPRAHQALDISLGTYGLHPLTVEPAGTIGEVAKLGAYLAFFGAVVTFASRRGRRELVLLAVVFVAALNAAIGMLQAAFGTKRILFFYGAAAEFGTLVRGTFVNPNHFGALMCLAAPCALVLAMRDAVYRKSATVALVLITAGAVLSLARAALIAVVIGLVLALVFSRVYPRDRRPLATRVWLMTVAIAGLAVVTGLALGMDQLRGIWQQTSLAELEDKGSKYHAWTQALRMILDYPWTGVGRGAFEQAFARVSDAAGFTRFAWIENAYLQILVDWGVPGGTLLLVLGGWALIVAFKRVRHDPLLIGALAGILALAAHELVDFAIELPGVALPALATLATLFARRSSEAEAGRRRVEVRPWWLLVPAAVAVAAVADAATRDAFDDGARLSEVSRDPARSAKDVADLGSKLRRRHPGDYFIPLVVGERLAIERHPHTIRWLNAAMFLNPRHPMPDLVAAEFFRASGLKVQALIEYKAAAGKSRYPWHVWEIAIRHFPAYDDMIRTVPHDVPHLRAFAQWMHRDRGRMENIERTLAMLLDLSPRDEHAVGELARLAIAKGNFAEAERRARELTGAEARRLDIEIKLAAGKLDEAQRLLDSAADGTDQVFHLEMILARKLWEKGELDRARARLERAERIWGVNRTLKARIHAARATVEERAGNVSQAEWERRQHDDLMGK